MATFAFPGIGSGLDVSSLVSAYLEQKRNIYLSPLETKKENYTAQNEALAELKNLTSQLSSKASLFSEISGGSLKKGAISSDETVLSATASNSAVQGSYTITASQLAKNATFSFASSAEVYTSTSDKISQGSAFSDTVTVTVGDSSDPMEEIQITVNENTTLSDFVTQFNSQSEGAVASLVNVGSTSSPNYKIVINSKNTGIAEGAISVEVGSTLSGRGAFDSNSHSEAQNAIFSVDGIGSGIERESNSVSDLLTGVTFTLRNTGTSTLSVSVDSEATTSIISDFVDAYNELYSFIKENDSVVQESNSKGEIKSIFGALASTSIDENLISSIRSVLSSSSTSGGNVNTYADLGITTERDGTLKFNEDTFKSALSSDPSRVNTIMTSIGQNLSSTTGVLYQYTKFGGLIGSIENSNNQNLNNVEKRISEIEARLAKDEEAYYARFARYDALIGKLSSMQSALSGLLQF